MARDIELRYESSPGSGLVRSTDLKSVVRALPKTLKAGTAHFGDDLLISYRSLTRGTGCSVKRGKQSRR